MRHVKAALAAAVVGCPSVAFAVAASDSASNSAYSFAAGGSWLGTNPTASENPAGNDNGGTGFNVWDFIGGYHLNNLSPYGRLNHFIDGVDFAASTYNNLGAPAFGLTTSNNPIDVTTVARRGFNQVLQPGETFKFDFDSPALYDTAQGSNSYPFTVITLYNSSGVKTFSIEAGANSNAGVFNWNYDDANAQDVNTGIAPTATSDGSNFSLQLLTATTGKLKFDGQTFDVAMMNGAPVLVEFTLYNNGSGNGSNAATGQREFFFNNLSITPSPSIWNKNDSVSNWSASGSWQFGVPNSPIAMAEFGSIITAARQVNVDAPQVVTTLTFNNANRYTLVGSTITMNNVSLTGTAAVNVLAGSHTISSALNLNRATTFTITPANSTLTVSNLTATNRDVTKAGAGTLEVNRVRGNALTVSAGTLKILSSGGALASSSRVTSLTVGSAKLDLTDNKVIVAGTAPGTLVGTTYTGVQGDVQRGYASGTWGGNGIRTSMSDALTNRTTIATVAAAEALSLSVGETTTWAGQTVTSGDTLLMYTYAGDLNVDGTINADDYAAIDLYATAAGSFGYGHGDINYDGKITADDYALIDTNFINLGSPFLTRGVGTTMSSVPEPAIGLTALIAVLPVGRRRRQTRI